MTLSPMYLSTRPPKRSTSWPSRRRARSTIDLTVSGSMRSATAVYPERSANSTVALRRSSGGLAGSTPGGARSGLATAGSAPPDGAAAPVPPPASAVPHSMQNFAAGGFSVPQVGQVRVSALPHAMQNLAPAGFSVPQLLQIPAAIVSNDTWVGKPRYVTCITVASGPAPPRLRGQPSTALEGSATLLGPTRIRDGGSCSVEANAYAGRGLRAGTADPGRGGRLRRRRRQRRGPTAGSPGDLQRRPRHQGLERRARHQRERLRRRSGHLQRLAQGAVPDRSVEPERGPAARPDRDRNR